MTDISKDRQDRFDAPLADMVWSQCVYCVHKHKGAATCAAFPDGIPQEILDNEVWHRTYYPGDNDIRFEARTPKTAT